MKASALQSLVDALAASSDSKHALERRLVQMGLGVIAALQVGDISFDQARRDLFNVDNYQALRRHRLSAALREFFQWAMELENVAEIAPDGLEESYRALGTLANRIMRGPAGRSRRVVRGQVHVGSLSREKALRAIQRAARALENRDAILAAASRGALTPAPGGGRR